MAKNRITDEISKAYTATTGGIADEFKKISGGALDINTLFGETRQRIIGIQTAIADTSPKITRLGGDTTKVTEAITAIATASRRNVIANSEDVAKLFAVSKVLKQEIGDIANSFLDVGIGISQIPDEIQKSVNYLQSIGVSTSQVMKDVNQNMDEMNRYQFEGGVQGLTKMAAQASMLRFNMQDTFRFAEKVLTPEGAIEVASAFQRLGVSVGSLVDPFSMMNQSINDPSGLQDSLAKAAKQFTFFDEKTKSFRISPQGVLTLREMEKSADLSSGSLSKMGLAAAELDARLSDISKAGLTIATEEDKQYLANIATMTDGKYMVTLEDGTKKELADLQQPEFDRLIDQQKKAPKDIQDIARHQLTTSQAVAADVNAIKVAVLGGIVTNQSLLKGIEGFRKGITEFSGAAFKELGSTEEVRNYTKTVFGDMKELLVDIGKNELSPGQAMTKIMESASKQGIEISKAFKEKADRIFTNARLNLNPQDNQVEKQADRLYELLGGSKITNDPGSRPISSLIEGRQTNQIQTATTGGGTSSTSSSKVNIDGGFQIDVNFKGDIGDLTPSQKQQIIKILTDKMNTTEFKEYIINQSTPNNDFSGISGSNPRRNK